MNLSYGHRMRRIPIFLATIGLIFLAYSGTSAEGISEHPQESHQKKLDIKELVFDHVLDAHQWHISDGLTIPLPIIVYTAEKGLDVFSSSRFYNGHDLVEYNGYKLQEGHIYLSATQQPVVDLSITKNVAMLFILAALLLLTLSSVARTFKKRQGKAPAGFQSLMEIIVIFLRDEVIKPNAGPKYERNLPYLLTLFFFIFFGNILGLLPGAPNLTGNIAFTITLAVFSFLMTNFSGNKGYWTHIFWTPGVPLLLRFIFLPVEILGLFTKPFALMIRLFVAMTAGHIVILSLVSLTFIFGSIWVGITTVPVLLFINLIEILVAAIQAYVFTLFTSLYIGMATEDHSHAPSYENH